MFIITAGRPEMKQENDGPICKDSLIKNQKHGTWLKLSMEIREEKNERSQVI